MTTDTSNINFQLAIDFIHFTNRSVFLTGKAGTGKTTFLKYIREHSNKQIAVLAPTGVAAINAGGVTIHSFLQLPFTPYIPVKMNGWNEGNEGFTDKNSLLRKVRLNKERIEIIQKLELLIIDEVSMVRADVMDAIDAVLRHYRYQHNQPFGGLQVLLIGDMFQLPPVVPNAEWQMLGSYYASPYFFDSLAIKQLEPACIELNKIYRQDDETFIRILNKIRHGNLDEDALQTLQQYYNPGFQPGKEEGYITLTTHNNRADAINTEELHQLHTTPYFFKATIEGEFSEKMFPIDEVLEFKQGSQVMFLKNDLDKAKRYFNGKIGTITKINKDEIFVTCKDDNLEIKVERYKWENVKYTLNPKKQEVEEEVIGSFEQYPLRMAWAITIHKSQGLTFDKAIIDAGAAFAAGQVYVALSRCRSLNGVVLVSKITQQSLFTDEHIKNFSRQLVNARLNDSLLFEKPLHQNNLLQGLFNFNEESKLAGSLHDFALLHKTTFNPAAAIFTEETNNRVLQYQRFGNKFKQELQALDDATLLPEQNPALQERFKKAAAWFSNELVLFKDAIQACQALTDNKDNAKHFNDELKALYIAVYCKQHILQNLASGFVYDDYIVAKRSVGQINFIVNVYSGKSKTGSYIHATHPALFNQLQELRNEICERENAPVYLIANTKSLDEMATYLPQTKQELMQINGFGKAKVDKYGFEFLEVINVYCQQHGLQSRLHTKATVKRERKADKEETKTEKTDTKELSYKMFSEGKSIADIAKERNFTTSTIEGHLSKYIANGSIDVTQLIPQQKVDIMLKALQGFEKGTSMTPIKETLGNDYSYGELRMVQAYLDYMTMVNEVK